MEIKVVTFNLRMDTKKDGVNYFFNRAYYIRSKILAERPDVIGFQEATVNILNWLKASLPEYTFAGIGRGARFDSEANPVAFLTEKFSLLSLDQFWLSPTPHVPGSRHADQSGCPRICVTTVLNIKNTDKLFRFYNTHLDHIGENARVLGMRSIIERIANDQKEIALPFVLTGDMNAFPDEACIRDILTTDIISVKDATKDVTVTFHNWGNEEKNIDYVFTNSDMETKDAKAWTDHYGDIYLTDHYPVEVTLTV